MRVVAYQLNPEVVAIVAAIMFTSSCAVRRRLNGMAGFRWGFRACTHAWRGSCRGLPSPLLFAGPCVLAKSGSWVVSPLEHLIGRQTLSRSWAAVVAQRTPDCCHPLVDFASLRSTTSHLSLLCFLLSPSLVSHRSFTRQKHSFISSIHQSRLHDESHTAGNIAPTPDTAEGLSSAHTRFHSYNPHQESPR